MRFDDDDNESAQRLLSEFASGRASSAADEETVDRLLSERGLSLARVLSTPPPSSQKRQTMANGGALQLRGKPQQVPVATAREVARLSDELNLDEEECLELWARVTDRRARRRLARRLGLSPTGLDGDFYGAAKLLFYLDIESGLGALLETTRGALDARLDANRRRLLFRHVRRMAGLEEGLVDALCSGIKALSGSSWSRTKERRRRAAFLASTAANCLFTAFYELQMTPAEAKRILETALDLSATIDEFDDWHARKYRAAAAAKISTADYPFLDDASEAESARLAARAAAVDLPVTSQPAAPHAGKLRLCRDVMILVVVQALDPRAELRSRNEDAEVDARALASPAWRSEDEDLKEAALGPAFPNALAGAIEPLEALVDNSEEQLPPRPARAVALAAAALSSAPADDGLLAPDAHRRLWKAVSPNAGNCCRVLSRDHALMRGACPNTGSLGDARNAYFEVVARLVEAVVEAVYVLEPHRQTTISTPRRRTSSADDDDDVVSDQAAEVTPAVVELVANLAERYPAFAEGFFALDVEEDDAEPLFIRLLRAVNVVAKRKPQLGLVPYLNLLAVAARNSEHRAGLVRDLLRDDFASAGLSLRELFDKLQRYCAMLEDGERRYRDHRAAIHLKHQQQLLLRTPTSQYAATSPTVSAVSARTRQSPSAAALAELEQETMVVPVILLPLDADILESIVVLVGSLCAPSRDHVEHICLAIAPSVGVDPSEALAHLARALLILYLRDSEAVPLDLKGECLRSLAALCVNDDAARDIAAMWERSRALAGPEEPNKTTGMTTTQTDEATIVVVAPPHDLSAYALEPPPERIVVARDAHAPPPVFAWPPEWRDPRSHHLSQRRLSGLQSSKGVASSPLQSAEHNLHTVLGGAHDLRRANSAAAQDAARLVAGSPYAMPTVFSAAFSSGRAELDLITETRIGCYAATEGVLCLGKELVRQTETNGAPLLSEVSRLALVTFASRSVLLRCASPARARRGIFLRRVDRWRLAARACDALVAIVRTYSPETDEWRRDFSETSMGTPASGSSVGGSRATHDADGTLALDFFVGSSSSKKDMAVTTSSKSASMYNGGASPPDSSSGGGVSAGFAVVYDSLTRSGGILRIVCELLASARDETEADDDDDEPNLDAKHLESHRLTRAAAAAAIHSLSAGLPEKAVDFLREAREQHEARLAEKGEEMNSRGAGVGWWRARCELVSLELLTAVADVETDFVEACRIAARSERSSSRAARAIVSSASGPPSSLAALVTSVRSATIPRADDDQQQLEAARRRAQQAASSPYVLDRPMTLEGVLADKANDIQEVAFFEAGLKRGDAALLLVELAKRVASSNDGHAALAIDLLRRVAVVATSEGDDGRLRAALACFAEDHESSTSMRADFANRLRGDDDDDDDDQQFADDDDTTRDTDFIAVTRKKASPRDLALQLLAETTGAGAEEHSIGHWLLGLDESAAHRGRDERGCLSALVEITFSFIAALGGDEDDFGEPSAPSTDLLEATPRVIVKRCRIAERGLDLLYRLAKARRTRSAAVEATASALGGSGLPRLVVGARLLAGAAASNPSAEEAAALNGAARAALDLAAVSTHAAKLPGVDLSDLARDRARAAVFEVFLQVSKQRNRHRGPRLEAVSSLFAAALRSSQAALAMAADVRSLLLSSGQYNDDEQRLLESGIGERRAASVDLAIALSRFCVVAVGYARQEAVDWIEPREHTLWEDGDDAANERNSSPKRLVAAVATAALDALLERREADVVAAEAAAHAAADACANLRAVTTADDPVDAAELEGIASQIGVALLEHRDSQAMSSSSASEAYRGHLYVALAHVLGAIALTESPSPENNVVVNRRRRRDQHLEDDEDGGGLSAEYAEVYEGHAVSEAAWTRVCDDAAKAATPWVRLSAASALSAAACGAATRDATFIDDLLRGAGFAAAAKNDVSRDLSSLSSSDRLIPSIDAEDQSLAIQRIETTLSALLRLSSQRAGAHAIAERSCVHVIASDDRVFLWSDVSPRCLLLALEIVRQLIRQLPRHARLHQEARDLVKNRDRALGKLLRDNGGGLSTARARTAYVGILASLEDAPNNNKNGVSSVEASRRSSLLWSLLATISSRAPYWPLPASSAYEGGGGVNPHDSPPWCDDDGAWWMDIQPAEGTEEALRAASPSPAPSRARRGWNGTKWTQFDDDKLRCSANTWARLVDFARHQAKSPDFDVDAVLAALSKATHLRRNAQHLCDADTLAARDLRINASFVLEASLQMLVDRLCSSVAGGTLSGEDPALRHDRKLHAAKILAALDQITFADDDDDDFGNRVKKRLVAALSLDS